MKHVSYAKLRLHVFVGVRKYCIQRCPGHMSARAGPRAAERGALSILLWLHTGHYSPVCRPTQGSRAHSQCCIMSSLWRRLLLLLLLLLVLLLLLPLLLLPLLLLLLLLLRVVLLLLLLLLLQLLVAYCFFYYYYYYYYYY